MSERWSRDLEEALGVDREEWRCFMHEVSAGRGESLSCCARGHVRRMPAGARCSARINGEVYCCPESLRPCPPEVEAAYRLGGRAAAEAVLRGGRPSTCTTE